MFLYGILGFAGWRYPENPFLGWGFHQQFFQGKLKLEYSYRMVLLISPREWFCIFKLKFLLYNFCSFQLIVKSYSQLSSDTVGNSLRRIIEVDPKFRITRCYFWLFQKMISCQFWTSVGIFGYWLSLTDEAIAISEIFLYE